MTAAGLPVETPASASPDPTRAVAIERGRPAWLAGARLATRIVASRPSSWPIGLAGFLARGAIVVFVLPVVVLPTPTGLATLFGPAIISVALAEPTLALIALAITGALAGVTIVAFGSLVGAAADVLLVRWAATAVGAAWGATTERPAGIRWVLVWRVLIVRLVAYLPMAVALAVGVARIIDVTYRELTSPGDLGVPLVVRVALGAPDTVIALTLAWVAGETIGGLAARRAILDGRGALPSVGWAVASLIRHPLASVGTLLLGSVGVVVAVVPALGLAVLAWSSTQAALLDGPDLAAIGTALLFVATWMTSLLFAGIAATWRSALWTAEVLRRHSRAM